MTDLQETLGALGALDPATRAELSVAALAVDPWGLGGALIRAPRPDLAEAFVARVQALIPAGTPLRRLPLSIPDDRLLGGLDLAMTLATGRPVGDRGLLAALNDGVLIVPAAERVGAALAARLTQMMDTGSVPTRAPGAAERADARVAIIGIDESDADDDPVHAALADRVAFLIALDATALPALYSTDDIAAARTLLPTVDTATAHVASLVMTAELFGIASLRAVRAALRAARVLAALDRRRATSAQDVATAAALVLGPRATRLPAPPPPEEQAPEDQPPPPPETTEQQQQDEATEQDVKELEEMMIAAMQATLPVGLTVDPKAKSPTSGGAAGREGSDRSGGQRGRQVGTRRGDPRTGGRLDLVETLRAAAPWQPLRRRAGQPDPRVRVQVRPDDFRIRKLFEPAGTTAIFVVDASGSAAVSRMAEAKGAVELLLAESYARRDEVALVAFRGTQAEILLSPTRAIAAAKRALAALPGGGGTPLASAIDRSLELAMRARREGNDTIVVFLTDARANVARDGSGGRPQAFADALQSARALRALEGTTLLIDTSPRPSDQAQQVAEAMGARYVFLPRTDARSIHAAVTAARQ